MRGLPGIAWSGVAAAALHPLRSAAVVSCVTAALAPVLAILALHEGLRDQARAAAREGPDLVVTGMRWGRPAPLGDAAFERLSAVPGVVAVAPRIVGPMTIGARAVPAVVVGVRPEDLPAGLRFAAGRAPAADGEVALGHGLARSLGVGAGATLPPFYRSRDGIRVVTVAGVFESDLPPWDANLVLASIDTARRLFDERGGATEAMVTCAEGYGDEVRRRIARLETLAAPDAEEPLAPRVLARADREALLAAEAAGAGGRAAFPWLLLVAAAVPVVAVASGAGLRERRRETGILKTLGWGTDEVLLRGFVESLLLAAAGTALAVIAAAACLSLPGGAGIGAVALPGVDGAAWGGVAWRFSPGAVVAGGALALAVVLVGTLPAGARAAAAGPMEATR